MNIEISCGLYARLSEIPLMLDTADSRKYLRSIYIERKSGQLYAVATNFKTAAIEHIGANEGPDEHTAIVVDPALIKQCEQELAFNSNLLIVANPMLGYTAIKSTFGYNYPGNAMVQLPEKNELTGWRNWFPDAMPTKTNGAMFWNTHLIYALASASPTGGLVFPEFIDAKYPVVVRDLDAPNWVGLFMPTIDGTKRTDPATIPDWVA